MSFRLKGCSHLVNCTNTIGSFACSACLTNYVFDGLGRCLYAGNARCIRGYVHHSALNTLMAGVEVYLRNGDGDLHGPPLFTTKSDDFGFFGFPVGRGTYTVYSQGISGPDTRYTKALFEG